MRILCQTIAKIDDKMVRNNLSKMQLYLREEALGTYNDYAHSKKLFCLTFICFNGSLVNKKN